MSSTKLMNTCNQVCGPTSEPILNKFSDRLYYYIIIPLFTGIIRTYHGREELTTEPSATTRANRLFNDGDIHGRVLAELVGTRQPRGTRTHDDNVGVGVGDHVGHVPAGHLARHDGLPDGLELEGLKIVGWWWRTRWWWWWCWCWCWHGRAEKEVVVVACMLGIEAEKGGGVTGKERRRVWGFSGEGGGGDDGGSHGCHWWRVWGLMDGVRYLWMVIRWGQKSWRKGEIMGLFDSCLHFCVFNFMNIMKKIKKK